MGVSFIRCVAASIGVLAIAATSASAQTAFQGLTPGTSMRADVERALGRETVSLGNAAEYRAPEGLKKVSVRYGPPVVSGNPEIAQARLAKAEAIEVTLVQPVTRRALAERFGVATGTTKTSNGKPIEYFDAPALLSFTYASADQASGVTSITYFSARAFAQAQGPPVGEPTIFNPRGPRGENVARESKPAPPPAPHSGNPDDAPGPRVITHAISIVDAVVIPGDSPTLMVTASDPAGDFTPNRRIDPFSYVRTSWKCPAGAGVAMEFLERAERKDAATTVVTTKVSPRALNEGCELRIRIQDDADNMSDWWVVKTAGR